MLVNQIIFLSLVCLLQVFAVRPVSNNQNEASRLPNCSYECGSLTRSMMSRDCPVTSQRCVCEFIDSYTLCAVSNCRGADLAAAIKAPLAVFMPEIMLVSSSTFEPFCLGGKHIIDINNKEAAESEDQEDKEKIKMSTTGVTVLEGEGMVLTSDHKGGMIAMVSELGSAEIDPEFKITIARARMGSVGTGAQVLYGASSSATALDTKLSMNFGVIFLLFLVVL